MIALLLATQSVAAPRPEDTERWSPEPPVVAPAPPASMAPPRGATILFDGRDLSGWVTARDGSPARWTVRDGAATVAKGTGNIETRARFGSYHFHLEYRIPADVAGTGQARGNSGVFLASLGPGDEGYELQILDGYRNRTYVNGQVGSLYKQHAPLANPALPPGVWQALDIDWTAPRFAADGRLRRPAKVTARLNGVLIQDRAVLAGPTLYVGTPGYRPHGRAPIKLQDHGDAVSFRNIWLVERRERPLRGPHAE